MSSSCSSNVLASHHISTSRPAMPTASRTARRTGGVRWMPVSTATMLLPAKNGTSPISALAKPRLQRVERLPGVTPR